MAVPAIRRRLLVGGWSAAPRDSPARKRAGCPKCPTPPVPRARLRGKHGRPSLSPRPLHRGSPRTTASRVFRPPPGPSRASECP